MGIEELAEHAAYIKGVRDCWEWKNKSRKGYGQIKIEGKDYNAQDYVRDSWKDYSLQELGSMVHLFAKRAGHRRNSEKRVKDMYDAQNYLNMMQFQLDDLKESFE